MNITKWKPISECDHQDVSDEAAGCPTCNYTLSSIIDYEMQRRETAAKEYNLLYRASERVWACALDLDGTTWARVSKDALEQLRKQLYKPGGDGIEGGDD